MANIEEIVKTHGRKPNLQQQKKGYDDVNFDEEEEESEEGEDKKKEKQEKNDKNDKVAVHTKPTNKKETRNSKPSQNKPDKIDRPDKPDGTPAKVSRSPSREDLGQARRARTPTTGHGGSKDEIENNNKEHRDTSHIKERHSDEKAEEANRKEVKKRSKLSNSSRPGRAHKEEPVADDDEQKAKAKRGPPKKNTGKRSPTRKSRERDTDKR